MPYWTTLFAHPDRLPLSASTSPADVEALLGPPSARHRDGRIVSLEYWPETAGALWVFSWQGGALLSVEILYRERRAAAAALPEWVTALTSVPATFADFRADVVREGAPVVEKSDDGWTLLSAATAEAKFDGDALYSLYFTWP
ncbi:hypothetical protein ACQP2F_19490 [Actinoplanes sp. CA-030573]|uniref:hypothetical protein n=1 Tax=Actinoplanes sp. CA-030573 TaxID=3239898 RepID=UPI003D8A5DBC